LCDDDGFFVFDDDDLSFVTHEALLRDGLQDDVAWSSAPLPAASTLPVTMTPPLVLKVPLPLRWDDEDDVFADVNCDDEFLYPAPPDPWAEVCMALPPAPVAAAAPCSPPVVPLVTALPTLTLPMAVQPTVRTESCLLDSLCGKKKMEQSKIPHPHVHHLQLYEFGRGHTCVGSVNGHKG
jgi:hypothetical protein